MHRTPIPCLALAVLVTSSVISCLHPVAERLLPRVNPVEELAAQLRDADWKKRADAARRLGATRRADAVASLTEAVGDPDRRVRLAVVRALARIGTRDAAEAMVEALDGASRWLRPEVADSLAALPAKVLSGLEAAIQILVPELGPKVTPRFRRLARALASIGEPALKTLLRAMNMPVWLDTKKYELADTKCQRNPCRVLVIWGSRSCSTFLGMAKNGVQGIERWNLYNILLPTIFGQIGKAAIPHLIVHLGKSGNEGDLAESTLSKMGAAVQPLVKLLRRRGQTTQVRTAVVRVLGKIRDKQATEVLLEALKNPVCAVSKAAARALAAIPTAKTFTTLAQRLKNGSKLQRLAIVQGARSGSGELATRLLILALVQNEVDVAVAAAQAFGTQKDKHHDMSLEEYIYAREWLKQKL